MQERSIVQRVAIGFAALASSAMLGRGEPAAAQQHGAHEHGVGVLNVAVDGNVFELELIAPGADIVGFERAPETEAEKTAVAAAVRTLEAGADLFRLPEAAGCVLAEAEVEAPFEDEDGDHDHDHKHGHKHGASSDGGGEAEHTEFHAHYRFECAEPGRATGFSTVYFDKFPAARELDVQAITPNGQVAVELTPADPQLEF